MEKLQKRLPLPNGSGIPCVGLGTWTLNGPGEEVEEAVKFAIESGYRHIDCAWNYANEDFVGKAVEEKISDGTVKREDLFITTKFWIRHNNPTLVRKALEDSLRRLRTPYIDMCLIHWPTAAKDGEITYEESTGFPFDANGKVIFAFHKIEDTWKALEECQKSGLAKNIGLSNFNSKQIARILKSCTIKPANIQIEISPHMANKRLVEFCKEQGILVTAFSPLGATGATWRKEGEPNVFDEPVLKDISATKGKSIAQVILRFHIQNGAVAIPKSVKPPRIKENIEVFDFELSEEEMGKIASLNRNFRVYRMGLMIGHPEYPFDEPL